MFLLIFIDTDQNAATGDPTRRRRLRDPARPGRVGLFQWNGSDYVQARVAVVADLLVRATGATIHISAADLGQDEGVRIRGARVLRRRARRQRQSGLHEPPARLRARSGPRLLHLPGADEARADGDGVHDRAEAGESGDARSRSRWPRTRTTRTARSRAGTVTCSASVAGQAHRRASRTSSRTASRVCVLRVPTTAKGQHRPRHDHADRAGHVR